MGYVHLARDTLLDRLVALKVLSERWRDRPELCERFLREARIAARLTHPHVVAIYDVGEHDGRPFMALEYVAGRDLRELLQDRGRLPLAEAVPILSAVAEALAAAHERGIVHRDVKPGNVFLGDDGVVKVGDFGIARLADGEATSGGLRFATPQFVAPEQVVGDEATVASDIYSLGATAFAVLCGRPPFVGKDAAWQQVHEAPPDPRALAPDLPEAVAALLLRSLSKVPAQRPQSSRDFAAELQAAACATIPPG
jgi:serine/threonine-protein kinase